MKKGWDFWCPWHKRLFPESKLEYCKAKRCKHYLKIMKGELDEKFKLGVHFTDFRL